MKSQESSHLKPRSRETAERREPASSFRREVAAHSNYLLTTLSLLVLTCTGDDAINPDSGEISATTSGGSASYVAGTNGAIADGATANGASSVTDGATADRATADGASSVTDGAIADDATADGASGGQGQRDASTTTDPGTLLTFTVDVSKDNHAISPYIYCQNASETSSEEMDRLVQINGIRLIRTGGNRFSAYNWENNASNAGSDFQFQNDGFLSASAEPGAAIKGVLQAAESGSVAALITGQLGDYVSADKNADGDVTQTANYLSARFKKNVFIKTGSLVNPPDVTDDSVYQDEFLNWVKNSYAESKVLISLDNEPDLWGTTHKEIWPTEPTYDDFINRNIEYGKMTRGQFAAAEVLGFVSFGWYGWRTFTGKYDSGDFLNYYLDKMKEAETAEGKRLIDYVDVHWYPEARGVGSDVNTRVTAGGTSGAEVDARLQAPRSLWDPGYVEASWISDTLKNEEPDSMGAINLIPRLKRQIGDHYPGTKLAVGEWNFGADAHITGGIATADVLGIFGRDSVDLACNFCANPDAIFRDGAYQIFGNYDSAGSRFGDTSVSASAADPVLSSIYAAKDANNPLRLTIVLINKDSAPHVAKVTVASDVKYNSALVYVLSEAASDTYNKVAHPQAAASVTATSVNEFSVNLPEYSIAMVVPSTDATAPTAPAWPTPAVVTETGWTFDKDTEGWKMDLMSPTTLGATLSWNATEGKPKAGSLEVHCPFAERKQQAQIMMSNQMLDLTDKKLQVNVRRKGAFDGGIMFFAGSAKTTSWVAHGWTMLTSEQWTTIVFDPVAAQAENADFDPKAVTYLGLIYATGDAGNTTPGPVTFYTDQIVVVSAN